VTSRDTGAGLAPDEKLCPYCAETIKAAAVKCRYCQSDLTGEPDSAPVEEPSRETTAVPETIEAEPGPAPEPEPEPEPDLVLPGSAGDRSSGTRLLAVLVVLCLLLGGALWYLVHRADHPRLSTAPNGQVTQSSFRNAAMSAASDDAAKILSYSYQTFDADRKRGEGLVTGEAAKEYKKAMDEVAANVASTKITLKATVLSVGTISVKEHEAKLLVFVDTSTTREGSQHQQFQQSRLVLTMTRKDGDWTVSKMDAF
jgi:Mce-associated membrane protein